MSEENSMQHNPKRKFKIRLHFDTKTDFSLNISDCHTKRSDRKAYLQQIAFFNDHIENKEDFDCLSELFH